MVAHEESHMHDAMAAKPKVCKGKADGVLVAANAGKQTKATEIAASNAEIECLKTKQKTGCEPCKQIIDQRINQMEGYRDSFK